MCVTSLSTRYTLPGAMMRTGGGWPSITRACTGLVCVRKSKSFIDPAVGGEPGGGSGALSICK